MDDEIQSVFSLFFDGTPAAVREIDTSRGDADFRATFIVETASGGKAVIKLADNDFTFPEKIAVWQRTVEEYRKLGYFAPGSSGTSPAPFPSSRSAGTDARPTPRNLRHIILSETGFRRTSAGTKRCMTAIWGTSGG